MRCITNHEYSQKKNKCNGKEDTDPENLITDLEEKMQHMGLSVKDMLMRYLFGITITIEMNYLKGPWDMNNWI